ncbi:uncharacterized protein METZ01_LOCUS238689, partial [marine metagenome]
YSCSYFIGRSPRAKRLVRIRGVKELLRWSGLCHHRRRSTRMKSCRSLS